MKLRIRSTKLFWPVLLLQFSGCVIYTPFEVVRFWADYNTERACNAQVECFDHLPPKTPRALADAMTRMMTMTTEDRRAMGRAALAHVTRSFALEVIVQGWEERYRDLATRRTAA